MTSWATWSLLLLLEGSLLLVAGCQSAIPRIDPREPGLAGRSSAELKELARGRAEYIAKCSGCHVLYRPSEGNLAYWSHWMDAMAARSRLDEEEHSRIERYLHAFAVTDTGSTAAGQAQGNDSGRSPSL